MMTQTKLDPDLEASLNAAAARYIVAMCDLAKARLNGRCEGCGDAFGQHTPRVKADDGSEWHEECWDDMRGSR
jgi:hypothetical protein